MRHYNLTRPARHWGHPLARNLSLVRVKVHFVLGTSPCLIIVPRWEKFLGAVHRVMAVRWRRIVQLKAAKIVLPTFRWNVEISCQMSNLRGFHLMFWRANELASPLLIGWNLQNCFKSLKLLKAERIQNEACCLHMRCFTVFELFFQHSYLLIWDKGKESCERKKWSIGGDR